MRYLWLVLVSFSVFASSAEAAPPDAALSRAVAQLSARLSDGAADPDLATVEYSVSTEQTATLFFLHDPSGGNATSQIIAFFAPSRADGRKRLALARYRLLAYRQIGSNSSRLFRANSGIVHNGRLELEGAAYLPKDAMCCPSRTLRSSFAVKNGHVAEQPLAPNYALKRTVRDELPRAIMHRGPHGRLA